MTRVSVDQIPVDVPASATLLDAIRAAGKSVPTLCHDERLTPSASCRVCLVDADGNGPVASCSTPVREGLRIGVQVGDQWRRDALQAIVAGLPSRALELPADRSELVRLCQELAVSADSAEVLAESRGTDLSHPYVKLDRDLCIACDRCVRACAEIQGTFAITLTGRGPDTVVAPGTGGLWAGSDCVSCGACVDTCPTGALSEPGLLDLGPIERWTRTTCGYCGVGCTLDVATRGQDVVTVRPAMDGSVNRGHACAKGRFAHGFVHSPDRLRTPLVRRNGRLAESTWDEALDLVADHLRRIPDPDRFAVISSARATNEENYLIQKFARVVLGTNNVDNCARLCHAPSAAGLAATFGLGGGTNSFEDLDDCDAILLAGANPTDAHPVVGSRLLQRTLDGARLIVVDPRRTSLARHADVHLAPRPGTNVAVFNGLAHLLIRDDLIDPDFLRTRATGYEALRELADAYPPEQVEKLSGVPAADLTAAAHLYGEANTPAIFYGLGITEHRYGTDGVRTLANLAVLCGAVGTETGGGVNPLRGQNNVQGASDMGALPDLLPGYQKVTDDEARDRFDTSWQARLPSTPGLRIPQMFDAARAGELDVLWVVGEDVLATDPNTAAVRGALDACPLVICNDLFLSSTAAAADVVLPVASWLEKDGTFVNFDRRFQRVRQVLVPPDGVRTDFAVFAEVARRLGRDLGCETSAAALDECASLAPHFAGLSHRRLEAGALHWPVAPGGDGTPTLYRDGFATPDRRAHLAARPYLPTETEPSPEYPFLLVTGRRAEHYNAGGMTRRTPSVGLRTKESLDVAPGDAACLGLEEGAFVEVTSASGSTVLPVTITDEVTAGEMFAGFHFPGAGVNELTSSVTDDPTSCPEYKLTAVRVRRIAPPGRS
ncbi:formate dehydrogenase major subunit [Kribbella amoyensis]|uniref:Formate dehydrogenase major subunit n=1 Tax=Kribbella amoyensis TaxID=996641 RepID=A0A561C0M0_9ACTN|nr:formate dehydrogenase subunit alpha [Kribbella amoyensis]TWD84597.1 formate dehydrogenase major subunit [Kribbella amoyensis]